MKKKALTAAGLIATARKFCGTAHNYVELFGVTDGKAVGTFVENKFRDVLEAEFTLLAGNSAKGLDLPSVETDIKVTSRRQPQSSCPFRSARQKVYGLGYNLLLLVYEKNDDHSTQTAHLVFTCCAFIEKQHTADYQLTRHILETLERDGNRDDIFALLMDRNLPGDEIILGQLADEIMVAPPLQGYLTISNALQWRLQYQRVVQLADAVPGIERIV